jgi:hypothetical protein
MHVTMCDNARRSFAETIVDVSIEQGELPECARDEAIEAYLAELASEFEVTLN